MCALEDAASPLGSRERFLRAARGGEVDRPPVWLMRQAGRYLPEYRQLRGDTPFMEFCRDVDRAVEVSLQPWRRFGMDGVILFSDILVPLKAMGVAVEIGESGPALAEPVRTSGRVAKLRSFDPEAETPFVPEIARRLRREIGDRAALIGFAGAPWTTACYAIEGTASQSFHVARTLARNEPGLVHDLLGRLADALARYLAAQVAAGVDVIQIFDTWAGDLSPEEYASVAAPYQKRVLEQVSPGVVKILYVKGAAPHIASMASVGADVLSVDSGTDILAGQGPGRAVQGNVDPNVLLGPTAGIAGAVRACVARTGGRGHIVNLGHGVVKETHPDAVGAFVEAVKSLPSSPA
ncbi:MAG: uroporphyrinogen decarboxylase [Acidobacteriota bacterium]